TPLVERSRQKRGLTAATVAEANAAAARHYPLGRLGTVEDIASLALFLASDEADWITGGIYTVDGGRSAVGTPPTHCPRKPSSSIPRAPGRPPVRGPTAPPPTGAPTLPRRGGAAAAPGATSVQPCRT